MSSILGINPMIYNTQNGNQFKFTGDTLKNYIN